MFEVKGCSLRSDPQPCVNFVDNRQWENKVLLAIFGVLVANVVFTNVEADPQSLANLMIGVEPVLADVLREDESNTCENLIDTGFDRLDQLIVSICAVWKLVESARDYLDLIERGISGTIRDQ